MRKIGGVFAGDRRAADDDDGGAETVGRRSWKHFRKEAFRP